MLVSYEFCGCEEGKQKPFVDEDEKEYIGNGDLSKRGRKTDPTMKKLFIMGSNLSRIKIRNKLFFLERERDRRVEMNRGKDRGRGVAYKKRIFDAFYIRAHCILHTSVLFSFFTLSHYLIVLPFMYFLYYLN